MSDVGEGDVAASARHSGAVRWLAPEALRSRQFSEASDAWSFGVLIFECCARREPFASDSIATVMRDVAQDARHETLPPAPHCTPALSALAHACWARDAAQRPRFTRIVTELDALLAVPAPCAALDTPLTPPQPLSASNSGSGSSAPPASGKVTS